MSSDLVIGVDGGGSRTRVWIARRDLPTKDGLIGRGSGGSANPRVVGTDEAIKNIDLAIQSAFEDANVQRQSVSSACIALAGTDREGERAPIQSWAQHVALADRVMITNDAVPILFSAVPSGVGIALISGTGSFAIGRNKDGKTIRCGGWGPVFGDEGSGYAIATDALRAAAKSADGRGPQTKLLARILDHLEVVSASELIPAIYSDRSDRARIAGLAPIAFDSANEGDSVAAEIIHSATQRLAELVRALANKLDFSAGQFTLAVSGGVLLNQTIFRDRLIDELAAQSCAPERSVTVPEPVAGAVVLAASPEGSFSG